VKRKRGRLSIYVLAILVLGAILASAFGIGYLVGKIVL
jgi:hypothetical protein